MTDQAKLDLEGMVARFVNALNPRAGQVIVSVPALELLLGQRLAALLQQQRELVDAMKEACDLLAERKYGSHARSPGHNARLTLEAALSKLEPRDVA